MFAIPSQDTFLARKIFQSEFFCSRIWQKSLKSILTIINNVIWLEVILKLEKKCVLSIFDLSETYLLLFA